MLRKIDFQKFPKNLNDFMCGSCHYLLALTEVLGKTSKNINEDSQKALKRMLSECKTNESSVWIWVLVSVMLLALAGGIGGTIFYFYRKKG